MSEEAKQQYGFYIPDLNMFMTIDATKEEFQKILQQYSLEQKQEKGRTSTNSKEEQFDDFDKVVEEVSRASHPPESLELQEFDF